MKDEEVAALQALHSAAAAVTGAKAAVVEKTGPDIKAILAWAVVGIPLAWGIWITLDQALALFR
jgi:hypothetical protein